MKEKFQFKSLREDLLKDSLISSKEDQWLKPYDSGSYSKDSALQILKRASLRQFDSSTREKIINSDSSAIAIVRANAVVPDGFIFRMRDDHLMDSLKKVHTKLVFVLETKGIIDQKEKASLLSEIDNEKVLFKYDLLCKIPQ